MHLEAVFKILFRSFPKLGLRYECNLQHLTEEWKLSFKLKENFQFKLKNNAIKYNLLINKYRYKIRKMFLTIKFQNSDGKIKETEKILSCVLLWISISLLKGLYGLLEFKNFFENQHKNLLMEEVEKTKPVKNMQFFAQISFNTQVMMPIKNQVSITYL